MANAIENKVLALPDGRNLGYCEYGDPQGAPVLYCHGFPGSRLEAALTHPVARQLGLRIVAADRPGFGLSDPQPKRTLLDWPRDVTILADALDLERFAMLGVSGGGPYALACAHTLARRLAAVTVVCGLAPLTAPGILTQANWLARTSFVLARRAPRALKLFHTFISLSIMRVHPERVLRWMAGLSAADRTLVEREEFLEPIAASIRESLRQGAGGVTTEFPLYARDWGFSLNEIELPIHIWHGDADTTVPIGHARYLANALSNVNLTVVPGKGHFSLPIDHMVEILSEFGGSNGLGDK